MTREFFLKESMIMLSVVIPTFNESKNIRNLVAQIDVALKGVDYEIVFVDDSKDNTPDVIMEVAKEYPQVRMEHRKNGTGLATAVLDGFKLAKGEYMAFYFFYFKCYVTAFFCIFNSIRQYINKYLAES